MGSVTGRVGGVSPPVPENNRGVDTPRSPRRANDPLWVRVLLTAAALAVMTVLVVVPVVSVFYEAFADGAAAYWRYLTADPDTRHAVLVTLTTLTIGVLPSRRTRVFRHWRPRRSRD